MSGAIKFLRFGIGVIAVTVLSAIISFFVAVIALPVFTGTGEVVGLPLLGRIIAWLFIFAMFLIVFYGEVNPRTVRKFFDAD